MQNLPGPPKDAEQTLLVDMKTAARILGIPFTAG